MDKTSILAALAELAEAKGTEPQQDTEVILSNLTILKATEGGEQWLEGYSADLNCNVRLNQDAVDALDKADFIRVVDETEKVSDRMQKKRIRGGVVRAVVSPVRLRQIEPGKTKREATMKKFVAVEKTSVAVPSKFAF